ncbi:MerR family transcriptional regulator [Candidatus Omnitrophota bacterium]
MINIYLLKDLARRSGQSIYTIKYYLKLGLLKEFARSPETNFRFFDDAALETLKTIRKMRLEGLSIKKIKEEMNNGKIR